ncbi:UNVERIFIED_CONTAM: 1,4-dihydroxy-2-naphthoate octaprenyltransferase [Acetivibrio alkalicellulosi]
MSKILPWIKASRLTAQGFVFPSILLGQAIAYYQKQEFDLTVFILIHTYGLFMHFFIVYANDYADYDTDKLNKAFTIFSGGSRVLVEGALTKKNLLYGSILMSSLCIFIGIIFWVILSNPLILFLILIGLFLLYAYSFKPFIVSYRGFGEVLQMLGVGIILPLIGFSSQNGSFETFPWQLLFLTLPSQLAMAISTSLPDQPSDLISSKKTTAVILGQKKAQVIMVLFYSLSLFLFIFTQSSLYLNTWGISILALLTFLIILQVFFSINKNTKPGTKKLTLLVFLSILTNTSFILGLTYLLI